MLVLSRSAGEKIIIEVPPSDTPTRIEVVAIQWRHGGKARIGVQAPDQVVIDREEIAARKLLEEQS